MRIPINSCEGCSKGLKILPGGTHSMGKGKWIVCEFLKAEMRDWKDSEFISVHENKREALKKASKSDAGLLWSGQGPKEFWIVIR